MSHLIRDIAGTNREPIYSLWRVCDRCPDDPEIPYEGEELQKVVDLVDQIPGMTLAEFWEAFVGAKLEQIVRRNS